MTPDDLSRVARLGLILKLTDADIGPIAGLAAAAGKELVVGASAHGGRMEVRLPNTEAAAKELAPEGSVVLDRADVVRIAIVGGERRSTFLRTGPAELEAALAEVAPAAAREAWGELVTSLGSIAGGRINAIGREVDREAAMIEVFYPTRDKDADAMLIEAVDELAGNLGVSPAQRTLFRRIHPQLGRGQEIVLTTRCTRDGISPTFGLAYPVRDWQTAMRVAEGVVLNDSEAKEVPRRLGAIAGASNTDTLESLEVVLGPHEPPDVLVWARVVP